MVNNMFKLLNFLANLKKMFNLLVAANKCLRYFIDKSYVSIKDG